MKTIYDHDVMFAYPTEAEREAFVAGYERCLLDVPLPEFVKRMKHLIDSFDFIARSNGRPNANDMYGIIEAKKVVNNIVDGGIVRVEKYEDV